MNSNIFDVSTADWWLRSASNYFKYSNYSHCAYYCTGSKSFHSHLGMKITSDIDRIQLEGIDWTNVIREKSVTPTCRI